MKAKGNLWGALAVLVVALVFVPATRGHEIPAGCTGGGPDVALTSPVLGEAAPYRIGDRLEFTVTVSNDAPGACAVSDLSLILQLPARDGGPGPRFQLAGDSDLPAGVSSVEFQAPVPYEIGFADGVFEGPVSVFWSAMEHSGETDEPVEGSLTDRLHITRPTAALTVEPSVKSGRAPLTVTYTYQLTNTSPEPEGPWRVHPPVLHSPRPQDYHDVIRDTNCSPVVYQSGDAYDPFPVPTLDPRSFADAPGEPETWTFTCTKVLTTPGIHSGTVTIDALNYADDRPWPTTPTGTEVKVTGSDLTVGKTHDGELIAGGQTTYTVRVRNNGNEPTSGRVVLTDHLPRGLVPVSMEGQGWNCDLSTLACDRSDSLGSGMAFPAVTLRTRVRRDPPSAVINRVTVENSGDTVPTNNSAEDPAMVRVPGVPASPPSNRFKIRGLKARRDGSVSIRIRVPGRGVITVDDHGKTNLFLEAVRRTRKAGTVTVNVLPTRKLKRRLAKRGRVRAALKITFIPRGGLPATRRLKLQAGKA
jgi:uncharacterized repeat protein (TIGR01451 family)